MSRSFDSGSWVTAENCLLPSLEVLMEVFSSYIGWRGEQNISYKGVETFL